MTEIAQAKRLRVRIKRWHGVATWTWGINEECCGICRNAFETCCPECTSPGDACPPGTLCILVSVTPCIS